MIISICLEEHPFHATTKISLNVTLEDLRISPKTQSRIYIHIHTVEIKVAYVVKTWFHLHTLCYVFFLKGMNDNISRKINMTMKEQGFMTTRKMTHVTLWDSTVSSFVWHSGLAEVWFSFLAKVLNSRTLSVSFRQKFDFSANGISDMFRFITLHKHLEA